MSHNSTEETLRGQWSEWLLALAQGLEAREYGYRTIARHLGRLRPLAVSFVERGLGPEDIQAPGALSEYFEEFSEGFYQLHGRSPGRASLSQIRSAFRHLVEFAQRSGRLSVPKKPTLPPYVAEYLDFGRVHRGLSESALGDHKRTLLGLRSFLLSRGHSEMAEVSLGLLDEFIQEYAQGRSRRTVSIAVGSLRAFLRWLFLVGRESEDRSGLLVGPRIYREMRLPKHLTDAQFEEFLSKVNRTTVSGKQEWAVILLVSLLGLRIGEVAALRLDDLDLEASRLHLHRPKTQRPSVMPLCPELREALEDYFLVRPETEHRELFVTRDKPIRPYAHGGSLGNRIRKHLSKVKGAPAVGPHTLRHTLARRLLQGGTPLPVIRRVLGHANSNSTGRYLRIATDELVEVADNYGELL